MDRLTRKLDNTENYTVEDGNITRAINKLAIFENIYEELEAEQIEISKKLEVLRNEGKMKSLKFRELMTKKLTNTTVLTIFRNYGL